VTKTGAEGSAVVELEPDERTGDSRPDRQVSSIKAIAGDHLGEDADDLIGDLRAISRPRVFIISGQSGVGKDAVIEQLR
jgi:putative ribosome biogenesis GTPase RsgA